MRFKWLVLLSLLPSAARAEIDLIALEPYVGQVIVEITFSGAKVTKPYVITREIQSAVGDTLRLDTLEEDVQRLRNLGIFASIDVNPTRHATGVGLEFRFKEMPWIFPYVAFRYNEENGWSVGPAASAVNLFGRAIYTTGRVLFGGTNTFEVRLVWPWIAADHLSLDLTAAHLIRDNVILDFEETSDEITPWVGTFIGEHGRAKVAFSWFRMESDSSGITLSDSNVDNLFRIGAAVGYDNRDSWRNPTRGWWNEVQVMKTGGSLGGDGNFWTWTFDFNRFQPTWRRQHFVAGILASLQSGTVGVDVPSYLQYFMGGANSIRGYDFDVLGKELFGKNQLIFTFEYQFEVLDVRPIPIWRWAIAAGLNIALFTDTGVAWGTDPTLELNDALSWDRTKTGIGAGLRFLIPGTDVARVDVAVGEDGEVQFHFGVWPKFVAQRLRIR